MITLIRKSTLAETDATIDLLARAYADPESVLARAYGEPEEMWAGRAAVAVLINQESPR